MALGTDWAGAVEALSNRPSKPPITIATALTLTIDFALNIFPPFYAAMRASSVVEEVASLGLSFQSDESALGTAAAVLAGPVVLKSPKLRKGD